MTISTDETARQDVGERYEKGGLTVSATTVPGELRVRVPAALDAAGRRLLADMIEGLLAPGGRRISIDLGRGKGLDASLLRQLRSLQASVATLGCQLSVSASAEGPRRLLQLTGLAAAPGGTTSTARRGPRRRRAATPAVTR